jgi:hypothetical protein
VQVLSASSSERSDFVATPARKRRLIAGLSFAVCVIFITSSSVRPSTS